MAPILNRIFRIAKSYSNKEEYSSGLIDEDEELKRIIEELSDNNRRNGGENSKTRFNDDFKRKSPYEILGVNSNSSVEDIKKAYKQKMKEYHPDRLENFAEELRDLAVKKTKEINKSYEEIRKSRGF